MERLRGVDWHVAEASLADGRDLVERYHYSGAASNTRVYLHGLYKNGGLPCRGVAWWIPPTKGAALKVYPEDWRGVLSLSRLVLDPEVPQNGCSFLLGASMRLIDRERWPCLVTYADQMQGHTGAIYRACNWEYAGETASEAVWTLGGKMISRKAGPKTRTKQEMLDLGAVMVGRSKKYRFIHK